MLLWDKLTLRDWFAGQALPEVLARAEGKEIAERSAAVAYEIADAMLLHRDQQVSSFTAKQMAQRILDRADMQLAMTEAADMSTDYAQRVRDAAAALLEAMGPNA